MTDQDNSTRLLFEMVADELERKMKRHGQRVSHCDGFEFEPTARVAAYLSSGRVVASYHAELLASYSRDVRTLRWGWADHVNRPGRIDAAVRAARSEGVTQFRTTHVRRIARADADRLAFLAMHLCRATALEIRERDGRVDYVALFERNARQLSSPTPPTPPETRRSSSFPPPSGTRALRSPPADLVAACTRAANEALHAVAPSFREAMFLVQVDRRDKVRFWVNIAVLTDAGHLDSIGATAPLNLAARDLVVGDLASGNGEWRELSIHITSPARGGAAVVRVG